MNQIEHPTAFSNLYYVTYLFSAGSVVVCCVVQLENSSVTTAVSSCNQLPALMSLHMKSAQHSFFFHSSLSAFHSLSISFEVFLYLIPSRLVTRYSSLMTFPFLPGQNIASQLFRDYFQTSSDGHSISI